MENFEDMRFSKIRDFDFQVKGAAFIEGQERIFSLFDLNFGMLPFATIRSRK